MACWLLLTSSWLPALHGGIGTFVVLVDVLDDYLSLLFLKGVGGVLDSGGLIELVAFLFLVRVFGGGAGGQFLELIPIIDDFVAASPALFEVVEDGFSGVVVTGAFRVLLLIVILQASVPLATFLALFAHY